MTMRSLLATLVVIAQLLGAGVANAAVLPDVGQIASGQIALFGKAIPLPPGEWRVAAATVGHVTGEDPGPYGTIGSVTMLPVASGAMPAFVIVRSNAIPVRGGWGPPPECIDETALSLSASEPRDLHNACTFVIAARSGRMAAWAGDASLAPQLPPWALVAGFRVSDRNDFVEARYGIVPASSAQAAWFGSRDTLDAQQQAMLDHLRDWAQQARQASFAALRDPADQVPPIAPLALTTDGAIAARGEDISSLRLGLYKLATYRAPVTLSNWALASVLAGDVWIGASVAAWQSITHSALYFGNEMAWEWPQTVPAMNIVATRPLVGAGAPDPASTAQGVLLNGKQVPLPAGNWIVLAEDSGPHATARMLGLLDGKTLRGLVAVRSNPTRTKDIFGTARDCSRSDVYFAAIRYDTPFDGYCSYAKAVTPADAVQGDPLWAQARASLTQAGAELPPVLLTVGARTRTRENFVDVRYYFPPDPALPVAEFATRHVAATPALLEQVVALQAWADLVQLPLELGVRGRLPGAMAEVPWPWPAAAVNEALVRQAHAALERLQQAGAIDAAELQRQLVLADAALAERERQRLSLWLRSAYKVATYRVLSYVDAVAVSWIITASPEQSFAYATINAVAQPIMAYMNEIGWAGSGVGRAAASLQPVDFPEIGGDPL